MRLTTMKHAIARPLVTGLPKMSAYRPPTTEIGEEALIPQIKRNTKKVGQLGARAHAIVKIVKTTKVVSMIILLP